MRRRSKHALKARIFLVCGVFILGMAGLVHRILKFQLFPDARIANLAHRQEAKTVELSRPRGTILDRNGKVFAHSVQVPSIFADPQRIENPTKIAREIAAILNLDARKLAKRLSKKGRRFAWIKRRISPSAAQKIKGAHFKGIYFTHEWERVYPVKEMGAQVIGLSGSEGKGLEGLELEYDAFLQNKGYSIRTGRDARGRAIFDDQSWSDRAKSSNVITTLNANLQSILERHLFQGAQRVDAKGAIGILMDPFNGEIFAMASYPAVNPNRTFSGHFHRWKNLGVQSVFEPGSTFKVFAMAAALEAGIVEPNMLLHCKQGSLVIGRNAITNIIDKAWLTPAQILKHSNNVGMARIGLSMGSELFIDHIKKQGFGMVTGIDFPGELPGLVRSVDRTNDLDLANLAFGQGLGVSALQLVRGMATVANGGIGVKPHLLKSIRKSDGQEVALDAWEYRQGRVLSESNAALLTSWLERVIERDGTGWRAKVPGYSTAGKTGTAQKFDVDAKKYSHEKLFVSFLGFAPAKHPTLVGYIAFDEPGDPKASGGKVAAPVFREVMAAALNHLGINEDDRQEFQLPGNESKPKLAQVSFGKAQQSSFLKNMRANQMPDLRGLNAKEFLVAAQKLGLPVKIKGSGYVHRQVPGPGQPFFRQKHLRVWLSPSGRGEVQ